MTCPICDKPTAKEFRPFCSERCKLRDLGNWASGTYAIPVKDLSTEDDSGHTEGSEDE